MSDKEPIKKDPTLQEGQENENRPSKEWVHDFNENAESFLEKVVNEKRKSFAKLDIDAGDWLKIQKNYRENITKEDYSKEINREYGQKKEQYMEALKDHLKVIIEKKGFYPESDQEYKDELIKEIAASQSVKLYEEKSVALMKECPESLRDTVKTTEEGLIEQYDDLSPERKVEVSSALIGDSTFSSFETYKKPISWFAFDVTYNNEDSSDDKYATVKKDEEYQRDSDSARARKKGVSPKNRAERDKDKESRFEFTKLEFLRNDNGDITGIDWDGDLVDFDWRDLMDHSSVAESGTFNISDARKIEHLLKEAKVYEQAIKKLNNERGLKQEEYKWLKKGLDEKINTLRSEYGEYLKMTKIVSDFDVKKPSHFYHEDKKKEEEEASKEEESRETDNVEDKELKDEKVKDVKNKNKDEKNKNKEVKDEKNKNEEVEDEEKKSISGFNFITPGEDPESVSSEEEEIINPLALELFSENTEGDKKKTVESGSSESLGGSGDRKVEDVNAAPDRSVHELEGNEEQSVVFKPEKKELQKKPDITPEPFFEQRDDDDVLLFEKEKIAGKPKKDKESDGSENYSEKEHEHDEPSDPASMSEDSRETRVEMERGESSEKESERAVEEIMEKFNIAEGPKNAEIVNFILQSVDSTGLLGESREAIIDLYFYNWNKENVPDSKVESTLVNLLEDSYAENKDFIQGVGDIHKDDNGNAIILLEKVGLSEVNKQKAEIVLYPTGVMSLKISQGENIEKVPLDEDNLKEVKKALHRFFEA
ncbi:MAG: hypothetical protein ACQEP6_00905 [Patescibacteria group bacterium]